MASLDKTEEPWFLKSNFPVQLPAHPAFTMSEAEFAAFLQKALKQGQDTEDETTTRELSTDATTSVNTDASDSTTVEIRNALEDTHVAQKEGDTEAASTAAPKPGPHRMVQGLVDFDVEAEQQEKATELAAKLDADGMMLTENADVAYRVTREPIVDLFYELEPVVQGKRLSELLDKAWEQDEVLTLKLIFNARSIHLGKGAKYPFYRCAGWLAKNHPLTLINNLRWLSRPVIAKKAEKKEENKDKVDDEMVLVDVKDVDENDPAYFDVRFGVAHGYWKDLLNLLVLAANAKLDPLADPTDVLNVDKRKDQATLRMLAEPAKAKRAETRDGRHATVASLFINDPTYCALHIAVARLFAEQLQQDLALLRGTDIKAKRAISPCAKWAPTANHAADKHTFIVSSIAEILYPVSKFEAAKTAERETYIRYAREAYRKDISALRAHLEVVERSISAENFEQIKYDRVPSVAMNTYAGLFANKDEAHFGEYLTKVATGKAKISGAVLLPSTLIKAVRGGSGSPGKTKKDALVQKKIEQMQGEVVDAQWKTLVQRIRDSGTLENSIAVCDVSGSMASPVFKDGTCPMDSAIGLSLLLAEVTKEPFGGHFITFSANPKVQKIDLTQSLRSKYDALLRSEWSMNTDFVAVFEKLILPMAIKNNLKQDEMVKRVFVFSDMQFDAASTAYQYPHYYARNPEPEVPKWNTSYERVSKLFADAGYEMPELVFWNLAGGRAGFLGTGGDETAPKPVTADEPGTALVSGYSQGMLKVFLDNGGFEDPEAEEDEVVVTSNDEDGEDVQVVTVKRQKTDPMAVVRKAVGHKAYEMLRVFD